MSYLTYLAKQLDERRKSSMEQAQQVARSILERRATDELPVLADALEDAGYGNEQVLDYMRANILMSQTGLHWLDELVHDFYPRLEGGADPEFSVIGEAERLGSQAFHEGVPNQPPYVRSDPRFDAWANSYRYAEEMYNEFEAGF